MQYKCVNCDNISVRWEGKCSSCGEWGTYEEIADPVRSKVGGKISSSGPSKPASTQSISKAEVDPSSYRKPTGIGELDRVLGGGFVDGEVVLLSGEPGVGKSTLLLQVSEKLAGKVKALYVSGEESISQLWGRYNRLAIKQDFDVTSETDVRSILSALEQGGYKFVVIDSIQAVMSPDSSGFPGSISQVRACGAQIVEFAKRQGVTVVIVGQINKSGSVAGPKILEHMVDCVLHLEGDEQGIYKILRAGKNRFGSTKEIGVFNMGSNGLQEVTNPSEIFTAEYTEESGTCIGAIAEGSRVIMIEVQALVIDRGDDQTPLRRVANGMKKQRLEMLCAVLSRKGGLFLGDKDVYVNISGSTNIYGNSLDLAVCSAIRSAVFNKPLPKRSLFIGEVSLTGGIKGFYGIDEVVSTAKRLGYASVFGPITTHVGKGRPSKMVVKSVYKVSEL